VADVVRHSKRRKPLPEGTQCDNFKKMHHYQWNTEKNVKLQAERGISFEQAVMHIEGGDLLDVYEHPNQTRYPGQQILVVRIGNYAYVVPFTESTEGRFLKTIIPSRIATREYLGEDNEKD
jgi:uncharacterized DUF497 family protein